VKILIIIFFLYTLSVGAQTAPPGGRLKEFFRGKTKIDNPFELRDPFKAPPSKQDSVQKKKGFFISGKGQYSNIQVKTVEKIDDIRLVGVLIGKERRALVNIAGNKDVIILKEGMKIGQDEAELKAILPGGIVLVEKIINVYGQEEFLETVIPISK
jgi:type IV pilus assembly protein PilP